MLLYVLLLPHLLATITDHQPMMSAPQMYQYEGLRSDQIRLLKIQNVQDIVMCSLITHFISNTPDFQALSYVWGKFETSEMINCNGKLLAVTSHLLQGLHSLYQQFGADQSFWIDAICINQKDTDEKAVQVPIMGKIYSTANSTIIWIGPSADDSDLAMSSISEMNKIFKPIHNLEVVNRHNATAYGLPAVEDPVWPALVRIMYREWFARMWVIQEAVLAKSLVVVCGEHLIAFEEVVQLANNCRLTRLIDDILFHHMISPGDSDQGFAVLPYLDHFRQQVSRGEEVYLVALLNAACNKLVTEPVDKIYGVLALMSKDMQSKITIDYSEVARKEYWRLYIAVGKLLLQEYGPVILDMTLTSTRRSEMPSWCPDFGSKPITNSLVRTFAAGLAEPDYDISLIPQPIVEIPGSDSLGFRGLEMDIIDVVLPLVSRAIDNKEANAYAASLLVECETQCANLSKVVYQSPEDIPIQHKITLVSCLLVDRNIYPVVQISEDYEIATRWYRSLCETDRTLPPLEGPAYIAAQRYTSAMSIAWQGRSYFSTKGGRVGLGPSSSQPGDSICIFFSAHVPHILRFDSAKESYQFVGEAFVCGLMSGIPFYAQNPTETYKTFVVS